MLLVTQLAVQLKLPDQWRLRLPPFWHAAVTDSYCLYWQLTGCNRAEVTPTCGHTTKSYATPDSVCVSLCLSGSKLGSSISAVIADKGCSVLRLLISIAQNSTISKQESCFSFGLSTDPAPMQSQEVSALLQNLAAQTEALACLEARHAVELSTLNTRYISEAADLLSRQAQEKQTAVNRVLQLHRQLALATQQNDVREVIFCLFF